VGYCARAFAHDYLREAEERVVRAVVEVSPEGTLGLTRHFHVRHDAARWKSSRR
jgi:hypothetical protein